MYWFGRYLDPVTLTCISRSSDFYTFYVPLSLGCILWKVSAEDIAIRGNGTGLEYICPTRHFVYIFFNPFFQLSAAKNEINLFNIHVLIVAPVTVTPAGAMKPSVEFLLFFGVFFFLYFSEKTRLIFHLNDLLSRSFSWNDKPHFLSFPSYFSRRKALPNACKKWLSTVKISYFWPKFSSVLLK